MKKTIFLVLTGLIGLCSCQNSSNQVHLRTVVVTQPLGVSTTDGETFSLPGIIKEGQTVQASFKTGGQINSLKVKEGDYVNKGLLVATLDDSDYKIAVDASQAQYAQLNNEVARIKTLYERNSVSKNEYERAIAQLEQVAADLQAKKNQLKYTALYSPISGYVQRIDAHIGEMVNAGTSVVTLLDVGRMEVEVNLPYNLYLQQNNLTNFKAYFNDKEYPLTKPNIIPKAESTQQYTMLLMLPADKELKEASGMNVEVKFAVSVTNKDREQKMTIPESAIVYEGSQACVWVLKQDSTVVRRPIETGTVIDGRVNVFNGLDGNETIIKAGVSMLHEGEKVRVLQQSSTNPGGLL